MRSSFVLLSATVVLGSSALATATEREPRSSSCEVDFASPVPEWITTLHSHVTKGFPSPTNCHFDFVFGLHGFDSRALQIALRTALERAYRTMPDDQTLATLPMAKIPNLDRALSSLLTDSPWLGATDTGVTLEGLVRIGDVVTEVEVRFDPFHRYFTVGPASDDDQVKLYYQLIVSPDGRLKLIDDPPLTRAAARARSELTHFTY